MSCVERVVTDDKVIVITRREYDRIVQFDDILKEVKIEYDEAYNEAPWEASDGWEHNIVSADRGAREDFVNRRGYTYRGYHGGAVCVEIDDKIVIEEWGVNGYPGCSKQVRVEIIAQAKRNAIDQLAKWYSNGWDWFVVSGEYQGYISSVCGLDCYDYAEEVRCEVAGEIADQMEENGYVVEGRPAPVVYGAEQKMENRRIRNDHYIVNAR